MWHISVEFCPVAKTSCPLLWCSCKAKGEAVAWPRPLRPPRPRTCCAMCLDLCALNRLGCLLVALDMSALINATLYSFEPIDRILKCPCTEPLFLFFFLFSISFGGEEVYLVIVAAIFNELFIYCVKAIYQLCIKYQYLVSSWFS